MVRRNWIAAGAALAVLAACGREDDGAVETATDAAESAEPAAEGAAPADAEAGPGESTEAAAPSQDADHPSSAAASPSLDVPIIEEDGSALAEIEGDEPLVSFSVPRGRLISESGLGAATWDMDLAAFKAALPGATFEFEPAYMVDFSALCAFEDGTELMCAAFFETDAANDGQTIEFLATENPSFRTAEGVGPGVQVSDAALIYGEAYFSYNVENESREYVDFDRGPAENVSFRPRSPSSPDGFAGIYAGEAGYNETTDHRPDAVIARVEVMTPRGR